MLTREEIALLPPRYKFIAMCGEGNAGAVVKCFDAVVEEIRALKILRGIFPTERTLFAEEFRTLAALHHPNLVQAFDFGALADGTLYFTMEYVDAVPVSKIFSKQTDKDRFHLFSSICIPFLNALGYVHGSGKFHGDIKPSNVLVSGQEDQQYTVRVVDFGITGIVGRDGEAGGTLEYAAPEILRGGRLSAVSDIYSAGVLFYELLTGELPFAGSQEKMIRGQLQTLAPPVSAKNTSIPPQCDDIIAKMLTKEDHRRWQGAREVARAFSSVLESVHAAMLSASHSWVPGKLYGREEEWRRLADIRDRSKKQACSVRMTGQAGSGKSRLLQEFLADSMIAGAKVCSVRMRPRMSVRDVVRALRSQIAPAAGEPALAESPEAQSPEDAASAIAALLARNAGDQQILVAFDQLDFADDATRSFVESLLWQTKESRNICCYCVERNGGADAEKIFDLEIAVGALELPAVEEILHGFFGAVDFLRTLARRLHEITGGNIGLIGDSLRLLEQKRVLILGNSGWECHADPQTLQMPADFGTELLRVYERTLSAAGGNLRKILTMAAIAGGSADANLVAGVLSLTESTARSELSKLCAAGLFRERAREPGMVEFVYPALCDAFAREIEDEERISLHRAIGEYLHSQGAPEKEYAEHLFLAGDYPQALPALETAGDMYLIEFSFRASAASYEQAIEALRRSRKNDKANEARLQLKLAEARGNAGERPAEGEAIQDAIMSAAAADDAAVLAGAYLREAVYYNATGDFARAERSAAKGKALAAGIGDEMVAARCEASVATSFHRRGAIKEFLVHSRESAAMFERAGALADAASALLDIGFAHALFLNEPALALEEYDRARAMFERAGSRRGAARAVGSIGLAHYWLGNHHESLRWLQQAYESFVQLRDIRGQSNALGNIARAEAVLKRYSVAIENATAAAALAKKIRDRFAEQKSLETAGLAYELIGMYERAREILSRSYALAQDIGNRAAEASSLQLLATLEIYEDRWGHALQVLDRAEQIAGELNETDAIISAHLWYAEFFVRQPIPDTAKARERIVAAEKLAAAGAKRGREIALLQLRVKIALLENNLTDARRFAEESVRLAGESLDSEEALHNIWYYHFKAFERSGDYATAKQSLERAYSLLMASANEIRDEAHKRSYLERVRENKEIIESYKRINREPLNTMPSLNEVMLRRLYNASSALNSVHDPNEVLNRLMDNAIEALRAERGLIFLFDEKDEALHLAAARNVDKSTIEDASKISEGILNDVFRRGKPLVTMNAGADDRFRDRPSVVNFRLTTVFCVPLVLRDKIIGTVYADSRGVPSGVEDNATTIEFLEAFANLAAVAIENARLHENLHRENVYLRKEIEERYAFDNIIGSSRAMKRVYELMRGALRGDSPVLIEGESGTGKELVARAIHFNGTRKNKQFIAIDCGALPETLLDSELFGHKKGAFTGATEDKTGLFEEAAGGTIFLDEITNTSPVFQAKLLRVVQEGEIRRVGDTTTRTVDVRIITATNKPLRDEIAAQRFREDLYYRLNVIPIRIPPLRERREDIPFLAQYFLSRYSERLQSPVRNISEELMNIFIQSEWRGNVRELENTLHRMMVFTATDILTSKSLPPDFPYPHGGKPSAQIIAKSAYSVQYTYSEVLREHFKNVLRSTGGNKSEAAKILGINRTTFLKKLQKLKLM